MSSLSHELIAATRVKDSDRMNFLPRHFGRYMMHFEQSVYTNLEHLCPSYRGGFWHFNELSNGGCYMTPSAHGGYPISVEGNGFSGVFDGDMVGIVATLFTLSSLSMRFPTVERFAERFHQLRAYACEHPDANLLMAAID